MSSGQSLIEAFLIWLIMIIVSISLSLGIAMPWDVLLSVLQTAGMDNVGSAWNTTADRGLLGNLILVIIYILPIIGGVNFFVTAVRRQQYDEQSVYSR